MAAADEVYNQTTGKTLAKEVVASVVQPPKFVARPMPKKRMLTPKIIDSENQAMKIINDDTARKRQLDSNVQQLHFVSQVNFNHETDKINEIPKVANNGWKT